MAVAPAFSSVPRFTVALDQLLFEVCEELQLTKTRYRLADERYCTLNELLEGDGSPFQHFAPKIYPQGSMALGTTVRLPNLTPHDLDFVLELSVAHYGVDPMALIQALYGFLRDHGV